MAEHPEKKKYRPTESERIAIKKGLDAKATGKSWTQDEAIEIVRQSREQWKKLTQKDRSA